MTGFLCNSICRTIYVLVYDYAKPHERSTKCHRTNNDDLVKLCVNPLNIRKIFYF